MTGKKNSLFILALIFGIISIIMGVLLIDDMFFGLVFALIPPLFLVPPVGIILSIILFFKMKKRKIEYSFKKLIWAIIVNVLGILLIILAFILDNSSGLAF